MKLQITINGKTYEAEVEVVEDDESLLPPSYPPYQPPTPTTYQPPTSAPTQTYTPGGAGEDKICRSPVTGLVIKVNIAAGQEVMANDLIIVLEAMKMEANVTAPCTGKVKSVNVSPGGSVKVNQIIVEFE